jgi:hypothetical protein
VVGVRAGRRRHATRQQEGPQRRAQARRTGATSRSSRPAQHEVAQHKQQRDQLQPAETECEPVGHPRPPTLGGDNFSAGTRRSMRPHQAPGRRCSPGRSSRCGWNGTVRRSAAPDRGSGRSPAGTSHRRHRPSDLRRLPPRLLCIGPGVRQESSAGRAEWPGDRVGWADTDRISHIDAGLEVTAALVTG